LDESTPEGVQISLKHDFHISNDYYYTVHNDTHKPEGRWLTIGRGRSDFKSVYHTEEKNQSLESTIHDPSPEDLLCEAFVVRTNTEQMRVAVKDMLREF
jgi:hypothetical protein